MKKTNTWFSLIEILIGMLIVSIIMISAFQALSAVWIAKIKLIERTKIEKQAYFATEKFFEMIKKWGTIDYEEYWNRYSFNTSYSSGHFDTMSGFWNNGSIYHCISGDWLINQMWTGGCLDNSVGYTNHLGVDFRNTDQKYNQYSLQFIDRNSDFDSDGWDEDWDTDGNILSDDDDLFLGIWPDAFSGSSDTNKVWELYFINWDGNERTYFRWNVGLDLDATLGSCSWWEAMTGTWCLGTIEFLKLSWYDYWDDFTPSTSDAWEADGKIDTWFIHNDFNASGTDIVAGSNAINYWQPIFPNSIHVSNVEFYVYPNKSLEYSWRDPDSSIFIAPYVQIKMTLQPSLKEKRKIKGSVPLVNISTTIQLSSLDLK